MPESVVCDMCGRLIERHASYVVRIEIFADPSMPSLEGEGLTAGDYEQMMHDLMEQMKGMTSDDLQDDVHRQFEHRVCRLCQRMLLANPLGKPRAAPVGQN